MRAADAEVYRAGRECVGRLLVNDGQAPFIEFWDFLIAEADEMGSAAHASGTRELLHLYEGPWSTPATAIPAPRRLSPRETTAQGP